MKIRLSFRNQIALLGAAVLVSLIAAGMVAVSVLRHTQAAIVNQAQIRAANAASILARTYEQRATPAQFAAADSAESANDTLRAIAASALSREPGTEGGYYSASTGALRGFSAPPTGAGPPPPPRPKHGPRAVGGELPPPERQAVLQVARAAVSSRNDVVQTRTGPADVGVIRATPVLIEGRVVGSAWVMARIPTPPSPDRGRTSFLVLFLAAVSLTSVVLAWLIARNLQQGVTRLEQGLLALEHDLDSRIPVDLEQAEFARVGAAVNRLASVLSANRAREREIETKLRHSERLAALGRVAAGVAHEIRNPLATMRLRTQMLHGLLGHGSRDGSGAERAERSTTMILEEIDRINSLVERLLTLARPVSLTRTRVDIPALLNNRVDAQRDRAAQLGVRIELQANDGQFLVSADAGKLAQVFDNVIRNALDALEDNDRERVLSLRVSGADGVVEIEISDTGNGIPVEHRDRVLEPFFTTRQSGTGLGLSISYELVKAHGGELSVRSGIALGTTVVIELGSEPGGKIVVAPTEELADLRLLGGPANGVGHQ